MTALNSTKIAENIALLEAEISALSAEADELSFKALSGDAKAKEALAGVHRKLNETQTDLATHKAAQSVALRKENAVSAADREAERQAAMVEAKQLAGEIITRARRVDVVLAEFEKLVEEIEPLERDLHRMLRRAGREASGGIIGQQGLAGMAIIQATTLRAPIHERPTKRLSQLASQAWGYLAEEEETAANDA